MTDITQTPDGDLSLDSGDIAYTESSGQHKRDLLLAGKGHYKESPASGIGAADFLNDTEPDNFFRTVRRECSRDGMKVKNISMTGGQLEIDAEYENSDR